ncbi:LLM class flavin-dependent oxidoreductase [Streptomyces tendae]|uniref:LLM class flavin-dependent oxidoreductase n=1 Tax=Streptomyces tendae TaxID=1932 RepID=UPI00381F2AB6
MELSSPLTCTGDPRTAADRAAALECAGPDALTGGRVLGGIGASGPQVVEVRHGRRHDRPLGRTREVVELSRRIWRREVIEHRGITDPPLPPEKGGTLGKPLKPLTHPVRGTVSVYVAALGPYVGGMGAPGRNFYHDPVCSYGYAAAAAAVQEHYLVDREKEAEAAVPAGLLEQICLAGPADHVRERVEAFRESGVTMFDATPVGADPARLIERVRGWL